MNHKKTLQTIRILAVLVFTALTNAAWAGSLEPSAAPAPTMKTLDEVEPRIPITQADIPLSIIQSGSYYLTSDVQVDPCAPANGIIVNVNDVTIDLMGYSLIGPGTGAGNYSGIKMTGQSNVEIRNGTVRNFGQIGIYENNSNGKEHRVIGVRAVSNGYGIYLLGYGHFIKDCTAADNGTDGIRAGLRSTVTGNTVYNNQSAGISTGDGCTISNNTVSDSGSYGIYAGNGCTVTNNTAWGNQNWGIRGGYGSTVTGNTARDNQNNGIVAYSGSTIAGNTAYNNQAHGISASGAGCTVTGNTTYGNQYNGIYLATGNSLVDQNTAYSNNQSAGGYANISTCFSCTFGTNHAP